LAALLLSSSSTAKTWRRGPQQEEHAMKETTYEELFSEELADLYDAERQIIQALPKMQEAASSEELASAFEEHLNETREQVKRLDKIFKDMGEKPGSRTCEGMQGLLKEGNRILTEIEKSPVRDAALIAAAQKVEHYEISGYGTARTMAEILGQDDAAELLQETLDEESNTDEVLTQIAEGLMGDEGVEEEEIVDEEEEEVEENG
jgi:ferritin-like metal-binding protein YciE